LLFETFEEKFETKKNHSANVVDNFLRKLVKVQTSTAARKESFSHARSICSIR
jgi:hypothetical protein